MQSVFDNNKIIEPEATIEETQHAQKIAVFDISHSVDRDYTVCWMVSETTTSPIVLNVEWENNKPYAYWFARLKQLGINTVALPFDAARTNKETLLSINKMFQREGFDVIKIKRLNIQEQIENGRWLLNNCRFNRDSIPALSEIGKFHEFKPKHGLEQDVVSSMMYAGQVLRKKDIKKLLAEKAYNNYNSNRNAYNNGISFFNGVA